MIRSNHTLAGIVLSACILASIGLAAEDDVFLPDLGEVPGVMTEDESPAPPPEPVEAEASPFDEGQAGAEEPEFQEIIPLPDSARIVPVPLDSTDEPERPERLEEPVVPELPFDSEPSRMADPDHGRNARAATATQDPPSWTEEPAVPVERMPAGDTTPRTTEYAALPQAVVARLGDREVTTREFYQTLKQEHGREVLSQLINRLLLKEELERRGETISSASLKSTFEKHMEKYRQTTKGEYDSTTFLRYHFGMTPDEYMREVVWPELAVRQLVRQTLNISDSDLFNYFYANREKYTRPEEVRVRHILVDPTSFLPTETSQVRAAGPREWDKAHKKALDLLNRVRGGADFLHLARTESDDRAAAARAGDLGFFPRGSMVKPFEDAAFSLKKGEVSDLVKTVYGYHILKQVDRIDPRLMRFSEIKEKVRSDYEAYMTRTTAQDILARLKQRALQEGRLVIQDPDLMPRSARDNR